MCVCVAFLANLLPILNTAKNIYEKRKEKEENSYLQFSSCCLLFSYGTNRIEELLNSLEFHLQTNSSLLYISIHVNRIIAYKSELLFCMFLFCKIQCQNWWQILHFWIQAIYSNITCNNPNQKTNNNCIMKSHLNKKISSLVTSDF